jgi:glyoxylase-like metal-dependent hydrolase (beta-lactamase superfamily II)
MDRITENIYAGFNFRGCNSGIVVTAEGVVMIDTPMVPAEANKWREEVSKLGEIKYIINNEPHNDHVAGNCWMGSTIISSEVTREAINNNRKEALEGQMGWMAPDAVPLPKDFRYRLPDITFTGELKLHLGKHTIHIIPVPGHTAGETAVFIPEERVVFVSDNVIMAMPIMIDAVPDKWLESLKKLQTLDVDKVIPGHGPVCGKAQIQTVYDNLKYCIDQVKAAVAKGWSLADIQEKLTMFERFPPMGPGDPMKQMRHESLAGLYEALKKQ